MSASCVWLANRLEEVHNDVVPELGYSDEGVTGMHYAWENVYVNDSADGTDTHTHAHTGAIRDTLPQSFGAQRCHHFTYLI